MAKPPTANQIHYLHDLGYDGLRPQTLEEASAAIDAMQKTGDEQDAEDAIRACRRTQLAPGGGCADSMLGLLKTFVTAGLAVLILCGGGYAAFNWLRGKNEQRPVEIQPVVRQVKQSPPQPVIDRQPEPKPKPEPLPVVEEKKPEPKPQVDPAEKERLAKAAAKKKKAEDEKHARTQLDAARSLMSANKKAAQDRLRRLIEQWPETEAAREAKLLLAK